MRLTWNVAASHLIFVTLAGALGSQACSSQDEPVVGRLTNKVHEEIKGGVNDTTDVNVLGLVNFSLGGLCTGSLIAPNLVLTAHHCVSKIINPAGLPAGAVQCGTTTFGPPAAGSQFHFTTKPSVTNPNGEYVGQEVIVPDGTVDLCKSDMALIILKTSVPDSVATPLIPRVDVPAMKGEPYKAIGYGGTDDMGTGAGTRRSRDGLFVKCSDNCGFLAAATDFLGDTGVCEGDSGGPAMDANGLVIGVTSRGLSGCISPVYGSVYKWADFIKNGAIHAAQVGGYEAPAWAMGAPTGTGGSGGSGGSSSTGAGGDTGVGAGGSGPGAGGSSATGTAPTGSACTSGEQCVGAKCIADQGHQYCSQACASDADCPTSFGYKCDTSVGVCVSTTIGGTGSTGTGGSDAMGGAQANPTSGSSGGCAVSADRDPTKPVPWKVAGVLALAGLVVRRRRK